MARTISEPISPSATLSKPTINKQSRRESSHRDCFCFQKYDQLFEQLLVVFHQLLQILSFFFCQSNTGQETTEVVQTMHVRTHKIIHLISKQIMCLDLCWTSVSTCQREQIQLELIALGKARYGVRQATAPSADGGTCIFQPLATILPVPRY